jgi:hypothetical protein
MGRSLARFGGCVVRAGLGALFAASSSCDPQLSGHVTPRVLPALRIEAALVSTALAAPAPPEPPLPVPSDAWAELLAGERAVRQAREALFPLHGVATHILAQVQAEPRTDAPVIGYLRRGARVRARSQQRGRGCEHAWHELATGGFVCEGRGFLLGPGLQTFEPSPVDPSVQDALPYRYAKNLRATLQYWRVPTRAEERVANELFAQQPDLFVSVAKPSPLQAPPPPPEPLPEVPDYVRQAMEPGFYVSVDRTEQREGEGAPEQHAFVRTVRGGYVAGDHLTDVQEPPPVGVVLSDSTPLPLGFVYRPQAKTFVRDPLSGELIAAEPLARWSALPLASDDPRGLDDAYRLSRSGAVVQRAALRVASVAPRPPLVPKRARLIHVRLAEQTLVAYEGTRPVFATVVSSGKAGFETPPGIFRIWSKHISTTMDGVAPSASAAAAAGATLGASAPAQSAQQPNADEAYSIEDVPWTMYFQGSYALHAAFWHERFGQVRSHGCINLSPADARWLFRWSTPILPADWHGVLATNDNPGTWVWIE